MKKTLAFAVAFLVVAGTAACQQDATDSKAKESKPSSSASTTHFGPLGHPEDVAITSCGVQHDDVLNSDNPMATIRITNHSSKASLYHIEVAFLGANNVQVDTGMATVTNLQPSGVAEERAQSYKTVAGGQKITCKLVTADRMSAIG